MQVFLRTEEAGGILLLLVAISTLIWANSPWRALYDAFLRALLNVQARNSMTSFPTPAVPMLDNA